MVHVSRKRARQLAVMGQLLDAEHPVDIVDIVRRLGFLQMDPTSAVARSEHLVLWSRLGNAFAPYQLGRLAYQERLLYEYKAFFYHAAEFPVHRPSMPGWPQGDSAWPRRVREWIDRNESFRHHLLDELEARGPLGSRDLEDRCVVPWRSSGWTHNRNVSQMLDFLSARGEVAVANRKGNQRIWDLAERVLPLDLPDIDPDQAVHRLAERRLRSLVVAKRKHFPADIGVAVEIEGVPGDWVADRELLDRPFVGRTALLSPFDRLIYDRERTGQLFEFEYRLEIYVPRAKRRWGYYVLPVLNGDRLVGRVDAKADARARVLHVPALHLESEAGPDDLDAARDLLNELAGWLGLGEVAIEKILPA